MQSKLPEDAGTGCVHVFCSDIKREGQAESKGEVGCFLQGLWPCRLSLTMGGASGHSDQADEEVLPPAVSPSWLLVMCTNHQT